MAALGVPVPVTLAVAWIALSVTGIPAVPVVPSGVALGAALLVPGAALPRYPGLRFGLPAGRRLARQWRQNRLAHA